MKATRRAPGAGVRNRDTLVVQKGKTVGRITARWGTRKAFYEYTGTVTLTSVKDRSARLKLTVVQTDSTGEESPCRVSSCTARAARPRHAVRRGHR